MNQQELADWLLSQGVDVTSWGHGSVKQLADLAAELQAGESVLSANPVRRDVQVVRVNVVQNGRTLIEGRQELKSGQMRERNMPPSEKMKRGELVDTAVFRCLAEELGLKPAQIQLEPDSRREYEELVESPSYPGLPSRYHIYEITAVVSGLPSENFWRNNDAHGNGDPVRRHFWVWQEANATAR